MSKKASWYPHQLVQYHGHYHKEKWETDENNRLPASKFPMQMGNTPHQLSIPPVTTGTTKHKKLVPVAVGGCHSIPQCVVMVNSTLYLQAADSAPMQSADMHPLKVELLQSPKECCLFNMGCPNVIVVTDH